MKPVAHLRFIRKLVRFLVRDFRQRAKKNAGDHQHYVGNYFKKYDTVKDYKY